MEQQTKAIRVQTDRDLKATVLSTPPPLLPPPFAAIIQFPILLYIGLIIWQ